MAITALSLYIVFALTAFGLRSFQHWRRTGSIGFRGVRGRVGSPEWCAGALFVAAVVLGLAAPALQQTGVVTPINPLDQSALHIVGLLLTLAGIVLVLFSQQAMGDSWRIGVDPQETTDLVTHGLFATMRNPIFSAMALAYLGLALMAPNVLAIVGLAALLVAIELQVRIVEEPYLRQIHGSAYTHYAARVGRFLPGIGFVRADRPRGS